MKKLLLSIFLLIIVFGVGYFFYNSKSSLSFKKSISHVEIDEERFTEVSVEITEKRLGTIPSLSDCQHSTFREEFGEFLVISSSKKLDQVKKTLDNKCRETFLESLKPNKFAIGMLVDDPGCHVKNMFKAYVNTYEKKFIVDHTQDMTEMSDCFMVIAPKLYWIYPDTSIDDSYKIILNKQQIK